MITLPSCTLVPVTDIDGEVITAFGDTTRVQIPATET